MPENKATGYAIVDVAGKQFRVEAGQELKVPHTEGEAGSSLKMDRVLLLNNGGTTLFGNPTVAGAAVDATVLRHGRDKKIIVFKFRRRTGYRRKAGHRQDFSILRINGINLAEAKPAAEAKAEKQLVEAAAKTAAKAGPKKATGETAAKPAAQKSAPKKPTSAKKTAAPKKSTEARKSTTPEKSTTAKKKTTGQKSTAAKKSIAKKKSGD